MQKEDVPVIKKCLNCGKDIKVKPSHFDRKKYCSRSCKVEFQKKNPPAFWKEMTKKQEVLCANCNNKLLRKPSEISKTNFCNYYVKLNTKEKIKLINT